MFPEEEMSLVQTLEGHTDDVTWCDFSGRSTLISGSADKTAKIWHWNSAGCFEEIENLSPLSGHKYGISCVRFSPFGTVIASCSIDGTLLLWNAQTGEQLAKLQHPSEAAIRVCAFSPSSSLLATGSDDEKAVLWDLSTRSVIRVFEGHEAMVSTCSFTPDSAFLMTGSTAGDLKLWDSRYGHGKCLCTQTESHDLGVLGSDFSSQFETSAGSSYNITTSYLFASCGNDDLVKVWQVKAGVTCAVTLLNTLKGHTANVMCCSFSKDGSILASGSGDKTVILWDPYSGKVLQKLENHSRYVTCCCFSSDGRLLVTGSNDRRIMVWSLDKGRCNQTDGSNVQLEEDKDEPLINFDSPCIGASIAEVARWSVDDVCHWLPRVGVEQYEDTFRSNEIDGQELLHLTHESLHNTLKIDAMGHRNKILRGVQALKNPLWQHHALTESDGDLPEEFYCPITHEIMRDPVIAADGYSYERSAISEWLESGKTTSPMTNEGLAHSHIVSNRVLHILIQKYLM